MSEVKKMPKCGFGVRKNFDGEKNFDTDYIAIEIKHRVKKVGEGDSDYVIEEYEEITKTPIKDVINSQADSVGMEAYLRPYILAGTNLPEVKVSDEVQDFSQFPEDPADAIKIGDDMMKAFNSLDPVLRGDAKTPEEFLSSIDEAKIKDYFMKKFNLDKKVDEKKKEEVK